MLSRLQGDSQILVIEEISKDQMRAETKEDMLLMEVKRRIQENDWNGLSKADPLWPFFLKRDGLQIDGDLIRCDGRVVVPMEMRAQVLDLLHVGHPGISKMRELARIHVWWPGLRSQIEEKVGNCDSCQETRGMPKASTTLPWPSSHVPWERIHLDYLQFHTEIC
jgi:hypothetical protein